ncbi:MAG TPA: hypothetical protein VEZ14_06905 [Dehalococcoidia bacterium]|nr:hypothetical protein [Dehalococcoidia bacterium]
MRKRIRGYIRDESLGITVPVGVVLGIGLLNLVDYLVTGIEIGVSPFGHHIVTILGVDFYYPTFLAGLIAWAAVALIAYALLIMPIADGSEPQESTRECPECKSDLAADARRCAFCTVQVQPLSAG